MKRLIVLLLTLMLAGCSSIKLTNEAKNGVSLTAGAEFDPATLVDVKEGTEVSYELAGNKYIITSGEETKEVPITYELTEIDGTLPVDLSIFYSDSTKLAKASYVFNEDETVMTVTDENGSFDVPVHVNYPSYTIADNIEIDTYVGYDINDFVTADEGVEITSTIDEENSTLNITLAKNNWTVNETREATLTNSSPYPIAYSSLYMYNGLRFDAPNQYYVFLSDNTAFGFHTDMDDKWACTYDANMMHCDHMGDSSYYFEGDYFYNNVNELNRGATKNVPGSYFLYEKVTDIDFIEDMISKPYQWN